MPYAFNINKCPNNCTEFELIKPDEELMKHFNEFENPFLICISTNSFSGYVTYINDYLIVTDEKIKANIFSEIKIDEKNYITILYEKQWYFLGPHYDRGVLILSWKFCGPIIIDKFNHCMISDDGRTKGNFLTMRDSDKRLYFIKKLLIMKNVR